jgi:C-8 sterol isomerase
MSRYIFDPEVIHQCAMKGLGHRKPEMFDVIAREIEKRYPGHIDHSQPWIYSIAGGAMIQMKLYFASLTEYVMIWGTPIGSEGHSGRHRVSFWDTVIDGEMWYFSEGQFEKRVYKPGDRVLVAKGQASGMNFTNGVWAVEYARGSIMLSMPFGLADEIFSTLDFATAIQTVALYTSLIGRHWGNPDNRDYPVLLGFKRAAALIMNLIGPAIVKALTPPPFIDINVPKPRTAPPARARLAAHSRNGHPAPKAGVGRGKTAARRRPPARSR